MNAWGVRKVKAYLALTEGVPKFEMGKRRNIGVFAISGFFTTSALELKLQLIWEQIRQQLPSRRGL